MRFCLIVATLGRDDPLHRLLASVAHQGVQASVVVVDQNDDDRLVPIIEQWKDAFPITHLRSERGLSRARNNGMTAIDGDIVGFPDDDCWYPHGLLRQVADALTRDPSLNGLTCPVRDEYGRSAARWAAKESDLTLANAWTRMSSASIFLRATAVDTIGDFDETLGVGAGTAWEGAEDLDYTLRGLRRGVRIRYRPDLVVLHPMTTTAPTPEGRHRAFAYGAGTGRAWRKNRVPLRLVAYNLLRPATGLLLRVAQGRLPEARVYGHALAGRVRGWMTR